MNSELVLFWALAAAGTTLCGWWLAARPRSILPRLGVPVASLVLTLAALVCMLLLTGEDVDHFFSRARHMILGSS